MKYSVIVSMLAILLTAGRVQAQPYPSHSITIVVPLPAGGGGADALTRIVGDRMSSLLGQPIIVENVPGAGGSIGVGRVVRAEPDGYTLSMGNWATHVGASAVYPVKYDVLKDLEPIAHLTDAPYWIVARKDLPVSNLKELMNWLHANATAAKAGTLGVGSGSYICAKYLQRKAGMKLRFIPYRGGPPAMQDLTAGRIDIMCDYAPNSLGFVRGGQIKALALMSKNRWFASPSTPTVDELGMRGFYFSSWQGLWAPKGTPKAIIEKLNAAVMQALTDPDVRKKINNLGQEIAPRADQKSDAFASLVKSEVDKWWPIIKAK
jgi:tripartite-type tricarboxylate transporter receptor subunit TctC